MIQELAPNIFRVIVPLADSPLKSHNACLIKGNDKHLLIDGGFGTQACFDSVLADIQEAGADIGNMDYLVTHCHADHWGLTGSLAQETCKTSNTTIYSSQWEGDCITDFLKNGWGSEFENMVQHGFALDWSTMLFGDHPGNRHSGAFPVPFTHLADGDILEYGGYAIQALIVPGHTPGMLTLYEPQNKLYIAMDHILGTITPNITSWHNGQDNLGLYLGSLDRVSAMDINLTVTGHRELVQNTRKRIEELKEHHKVRLEEVLGILHKGPANAYTVASHMTWSIRARNWEDFPVPQRWFATGEALAHLEHLECIGLVTSRIDKGEMIFQHALE